MAMRKRLLLPTLGGIHLLGNTLRIAEGSMIPSLLTLNRR